MFSRFRLLPVTIGVALVLLTLKIGDVWLGAGDILGASTAIGAEHAAASPAEDGDNAAQDGAKFDREEAEFAARLAAPDVTEISPTEIQMLENLATRRVLLDAREREIDMREKLLAAAEARVGVKIAELKEIHAAIESLIIQFDSVEDAKIKSLVKIYENMKPKDAARIFNGLELDVLIAVMQRMREAKAAAIIAKMDGETAMIITTELALRRELPDVATIAANGEDQR